MRNVSHEFLDKRKTHFMVNNFFSENHVFYEIMWKHIIQPKRQQIIIWRMRTYQFTNTAKVVARTRPSCFLKMHEKSYEHEKQLSIILSLRHTTEAEWGVLSFYAHSYFVIIRVKKIRNQWPLAQLSCLRPLFTHKWKPPNYETDFY